MVLGPRLVNVSMVNVTMALVNIMDVMNIQSCEDHTIGFSTVLFYFHET